MGLGFRSNPNLHRAHRGPFRVRIEARQGVGGAGRISGKLIERIDLYVGDRNGEKVVEQRAHTKPAVRLPSASRNLELPAAARKSDLPLSRFPLRGKAGAGGFPPRRWHAVRQQKALAHIDAAAPPARGVSKRSAETPLAHPPDGHHRCRVPMLGLDLRDRSGRKQVGWPPRRP
jgi:hypothetical protein